MKRTYLGLIYLIVCVLVIPYIFLETLTTSYGSQQFVLLSLFSSLFLIPFGIAGEMILTKMGRSRQVNTLSKDINKVKVVKKITSNNDFSAPIFLFAMNPGLWLAAKAMEKKETLYFLKIKTINNTEQQIQVSKAQFEACQENDLIQVEVSQVQEKYELCWFEMLLMGNFVDSVMEDYQKYKVITI